MTLRGFTRIFWSLLGAGLALLVSALVAFTVIHRERLASILFSLGVLFIGAGMLTNTIGVIKLRKAWGRGGLYDANWIDAVLFLCVTAVCIWVALPIFNSPYMRHHS